MYCCCYSMIPGGVNWQCEPLVSVACFLYALVFPYIFLLFDCFEWVLIDHIEKRRVHSELWQFQMGGGQLAVWAFGIYCFLYALVFPYIFLLFDCFKWVLIDHIEKPRVHSELWQFQMGGYILRFTWCHTDISLYLPIIWLFRMGAHWPHWKGVEFTQHSGSFEWWREGGRVHQFYLVSHWHFLISSYYLTVSNGCSLTALKSIEFTQHSGSFKWGVGREGSSVLPG